MPKQVTIAGILFASQVAGERHAQDILYADEMGTPVDSQHWPFLQQLLFARPAKVAELSGRKVIGFVRDRQPHEHSHKVWTENFWAVLEDGGRLDFSFKQSIKALADAQLQSRGR